MDIHGRSLYKATVLRAHVGAYACIDMNVLILAQDFEAARSVLMRSVRGWKRDREYFLEEIDFQYYHNLELEYRKLLDRTGFLYCERSDGSRIILDEFNT
jgi:hypothetical protein